LFFITLKQRAQSLSSRIGHPGSPSVGQVRLLPMLFSPIRNPASWICPLLRGSLSLQKATVPSAAMVTDYATGAE
jgi:hypothetical protein